VPQNKNVAGVKETRLNSLKKDVAEKSAAYQKLIKKPEPNVHVMPDEGYCSNPHYTSINQRTDSRQRAARTKAGLTDRPELPKEVAGEIGLGW
jgi:hypothetical protein